MNKNILFIEKITNHYNMIGGAEILYRTIKNPPITPWLDWIGAGIKKYEGRLNRGGWPKLKSGDIIYWTDGRKTVQTRVTALKFYNNFGSAFKDLGSQLVPVKGITEEKVNELYSKYFSENDIKKYGVIAIGLEVIKS